MKLHYVYYAIKENGKLKVGCTQNPKFRPRLGKYQEFILLEAYPCSKTAGDREIELQLKYFGKRDSKLHYVDLLKRQEVRVTKGRLTRKKNNTKIKITTDDIKRGHTTRIKNLERYSKIFVGKNNGYEPPKPKIPHLEKKYVGVNHQDAKLNPELVKQIRIEFEKNNKSITELASNYGVTYMAIKKVVRRMSWKHVN